MTTHDLPMTPAAPSRAPRRHTGWLPAVAVAIGIAAAAGLVACSSGEVDGALETSEPPRTGMGRGAGSPTLVDHASVDWARLPSEPDPSPRSVAAYGN